MMTFYACEKLYGHRWYFIDEDVIFDNVAPEWNDYCHQELYREFDEVERQV